MFLQRIEHRCVLAPEAIAEAVVLIAQRECPKRGKRRRRQTGKTLLFTSLCRVPNLLVAAYAASSEV